MLEEERRRVQLMHQESITAQHNSMKQDNIVRETTNAARETAASLQRACSALGDFTMRPFAKKGGGAADEAAASGREWTGGGMRNPNSLRSPRGNRSVEWSESVAGQQATPSPPARQLSSIASGETVGR